MAQKTRTQLKALFETGAPLDQAAFIDLLDSLLDILDDDATQAQVDAGTATGVYVNPATFAGASKWDTKVGSTDVLSIVQLTQAQYDALSPAVSTTLYIIID